MGLHLILAHASAASEAGAAALAHLHHQHFEWPHLRQLLGLMRPSRRLEGDDDSLSIPHETVLAHAWGWQGSDGHWPLAALGAQQDGVLGSTMTTTTTTTTGWGQLTPCHWHVGSDQISMLDPAGLNLSAAESHALLATLQPSFEAEGWPLDWGAPVRWYTRHAVLADLPTASLDRAIGHSIHLWLHDTSPVARRLRRLQVEAQMLWHEHPVNQARQARGELSVNSFWISGCGRPQAQRTTPDMKVQLEDALRAPLLAGDWAAWCQTWRELDAQLMADLVARVQRGEHVRLTLCGERHAQTFDSHPRPSWLDQLKGLGQRWQPNPVGPLLAAL